MEVLLLLIGLAFVIAPFAGFAMVLKARERLSALEDRLDALSDRIDRLAPDAERPRPAERAAPRLAERPARVAPPVPAEPPVSPEAMPEPEAAGAGARAAYDRKAELPPASVPPVAPAPPSTGLADFEQRFGTKWVVWIGGLSLALGGIFLVRYAIERELIGPGVRVALGALLAATLLGLGEWTRRQETLTGLVGLPRANIPAILTAAGTTVAYATVYAAYELYHFLAPATAFVLLGAVAVATLAAALLHGPALGGLGVIGAYLTPMLVSSAQPNYWALYVYLAVVGAAALGLARFRLWLWLAATAVLLAALWTLPGLEHGPAMALAPHLFHVSVYYALVAALVVAGLLYGPEPPPRRVDKLSSAALALFLFATLLIVVASRHDPAALAVFSILVTATVVIAWRTDAAIGALPVAALVATLLLLKWSVAPLVDSLIFPAGLAAGLVPEPPRFDTNTHLMLGLSYAALFGLSGFLAQGRSVQPRISITWAFTAVATPLALLVALYYRLTHFEPSYLFAGIALALAALFGLATEALLRRPPRSGLAAASAIFAVGSVGSLALALTFALEKGWLTVALALMAPGIAWVSEQRPLPFLRRVTGIIVAIVLVRIVLNPRIVAGDIGTTPIFNWLLYGYGVPALSFGYAGALLRRRADDAPTRIAEAGAVLFTALLGFFELRHLLYAGDILHRHIGLAELALDITMGITLAVGLERISERTGSVVHRTAARLFAVATFVGIVFGLFLEKNPMLTGEPVGGPFLNLILLGYGLPLVLVVVAALYFRPRLTEHLRWLAAILIVMLALAYLSLEVRTLYHGPVLTAGPTTQAEQYAYSSVWLVFGIVLLAPGILLRSLPLRLASLAVIALTIGKVFLYDLSGLSGAYRAFSFIGLGLVLVGIGWLYQKILFPPRAATATPTAAPSA